MRLLKAMDSSTGHPVPLGGVTAKVLPKELGRDYSGALRSQVGYLVDSIPASMALTDLGTSPGDFHLDARVDRFTRATGHLAPEIVTLTPSEPVAVHYDVGNPVLRGLCTTQCYDGLRMGMSEGSGFGNDSVVDVRIMRPFV